MWRRRVCASMLDGVPVLNHFHAVFKILLKDESIRRLDPLVIHLFQVHNFKAEFLVELDGALVVHLDVPKRKTILLIRVRVEQFHALLLTKICCQSCRRPPRTSEYD